MKKQILVFFEIIKLKDQLKNLILFIPIFFSGDFFNKVNLYSTLKIFFLFFLATSIIYSFNNFFDFDNDKKNNIQNNIYLSFLKKNSLLKINFIIVFLFICSFELIEVSILSKKLIITYIVLFILYTLVLKRIPFIEIIIIPFGYILRVMSASYETGFYTNIVIYLLIYNLVFFIISCKRFSEYNLAINKRFVFQYYNDSILKIFINLSAFLSVSLHLYYSILLIGNQNNSLFIKLLSNILVFTAISRISISCYNSSKLYDPIKYLFKFDQITLIIILLYFIIFSINLYSF